jgi:WD40 repeat protein
LRLAEIGLGGITVYSVAFSLDGKTLAAGYGRFIEGGGVVLWELSARDRLAGEPLPMREGSITSVAFSPDGRTLAAGHHRFRIDGGGSGVVLWDMSTRKRLAEEPLPVKEGKVSSIAFSPDGKTLAAGYYRFGVGDSKFGVVLWDMSTRKRLAEEPLPVKEGQVSSIAFSPDGKTLAAECSFSMVLWNVSTRERLQEYRVAAGERQFRSVIFSPDGSTVITGYDPSGRDRAGIVLWDVSARRRLLKEALLGVEDAVPSAASNPNGTILAVGYGHRLGHDGGSVMLWDMSFESWMRRAGQIANRNFTLDEWREYFLDEPYRATFPELPVPPEVLSQVGESRR